MNRQLAEAVGEAVSTAMRLNAMTLDWLDDLADLLICHAMHTSGLGKIGAIV